MSNQLDELFNKIKELEDELVVELQKQHEEFAYEIKKRRIYFEKEVIRRDKLLVKRVIQYIKEAPIKHILCAPVIWLGIVPALFLDLFVTIYQMICFPIYGIPKAKRQDYIVFDRQFLNYLNVIEKINCAYCSYFNGLIAYVQEIAARTEQFWCPIKHARRISTLHSRYQNFFDYGDGAKYRAKGQTVRHDFTDLQ